MNRTETVKLLSIIKDCYPTFLKNSGDFESVVELWAVTLATYDADYITAGLCRLLTTCKFPPSVAEVIESAKSQVIDVLEIATRKQAGIPVPPGAWVYGGLNKPPVKYTM